MVKDYFKILHPEMEEEINQMRKNRKGDSNQKQEQDLELDDFEDEEVAAFEGTVDPQEPTDSSDVEDLELDDFEDEEVATFEGTVDPQEPTESSDMEDLESDDFEDEKTTPPKNSTDSDKQTANPDMQTFLENYLSKLIEQNKQLLASNEELSKKVEEASPKKKKKKEKKKRHLIKRLTIATTTLFIVAGGFNMIKGYRQHKAELRFLQTTEQENHSANLNAVIDQIATDENTYLYREVSIDPALETWESIAETYGVNVLDLEENNESFSSGTVIIPYLVDNDVLEENLHEVPYDATMRLSDFAKANEVSMQTLEYLNPGIQDGLASEVTIPDFHALGSKNNLGTHK